MVERKKKKVFVGLSGGVDSSVAALLLRDEGYEVIGVHIKGYNIDGCGEVDALDARRAAGRIGIPFFVWDMEEEYKKKVVDYMLLGYRRGVTPNPDVMCNKEIKFGLFLEKALEYGADYIATGHYVQRIEDKGRIRLFAADDKTKDQSYFLWTLTQKELKKSLFPLGSLLKKDVRKIALKAGLNTAAKRDSQGICFLGKVNMSDFLGKFIKKNPGPIITTDGDVVGTHKGLSFYTIGQRHLDAGELDFGRRGNEAVRPHYVARKDEKNNALIIAEGSDNPALFTKEIALKNANIQSGNKIFSGRVLARVRYRQPVSSAFFKISDKRGKIVFDKPQKFVASGQSAVFYSDEGEMIGGGVII
ncbi:MAG: tRNA 2-thiouridine(34) synthase MnmA [Candidatus Colwellbacteria bacterium]|nr:tRNA 2-thiouridine(34) synthase MnmA [Candidatus Colwellbacteria bacterium]